MKAQDYFEIRVRIWLESHETEILNLDWRLAHEIFSNQPDIRTV